MRAGGGDVGVPRPFEGPRARARLDRRAARRDAPHVRALNACVEAIAARHGPTPYFDPCDGGVHARLLVLLESPAARRESVGFVSRDNPGPTQRHLKRLLADASLPRSRSVLWNVVPWIVDGKGGPGPTRRAVEVDAGIAALEPVIELLPLLRVVILAGRRAQRAEPMLRAKLRRVEILAMPHPSPISLCTDPSLERRIVATLATARRILRRPAA